MLEVWHKNSKISWWQSKKMVLTITFDASMADHRCKDQSDRSHFKIKGFTYLTKKLDCVTRV